MKCCVIKKLLFSLLVLTVGQTYTMDNMPGDIEFADNDQSAEINLGEIVASMQQSLHM